MKKLLLVLVLLLITAIPAEAIVERYVVFVERSTCEGWDVRAKEVYSPFNGEKEITLTELAAGSWGDPSRTEKVAATVFYQDGDGQAYGFVFSIKERPKLCKSGGQWTEGGRGYVLPRMPPG